MDELKPELSLAIIEDLKAKGYSQSEIARMFGVTRQAISAWKVKYNGKLTPREEALKHFPWKVSTLQTQCQPYRFMRDHAEYMATGGKGMDEKKLGRLKVFYRKVLDGFVVEHDPDLPPEAGVSVHGGWAWRRHLESDGDLIIRVNKFVNLTDEGRLLWTLPPNVTSLMGVNDD